ncbi:hypothetical protein [Paenibacillus naphthalenovorans]|uniref:Uncharacterized protein n=1 Tax=Paenibacillus naphthalenovorans TaxID=162209 RepID=A0A0U2W716_9BACL|nr:hypothetical protein [Paenibacillus naphthalenovorans]ALS22238.1 hypothetical protein IJ22_18640 [Paenibacillus naphthalenovorans]
MFINRRFIEREYVFNIEKKNNPYISDEQINNMLDSMDLDWCDLTFKFFERKNGWDTVIIDNNTNNRVVIDELNGFAFDFYIRQIKELSITRARKEIREKLFAGVGA